MTRVRTSQDDIREAIAILRKGQSKGFTALANRLVRLSRRIEAADGDRLLLRRLRREEMEVRREFAELLSPDHTGLRTHLQRGKRFVARYNVVGLPKKKWKDQAKEWMANRSVSWDGSAPLLRDEVSKALTHSEAVPDHYFGLHCRWSVVIEELLPPPDLPMFDDDEWKEIGELTFT